MIDKLSDKNLSLGTHFVPSIKNVSKKVNEVINTINIISPTSNVSIIRAHEIYALGDSITANTAYQIRLISLLGPSWNTVSYGIGGNTTTQMIARLSSLTIGDAEYVIVLAGVNDVIGSISAATIQTNLQTIYTTLAATGTKVIALTITPFKNNVNWSAGKQTVLTTVNSWILNTATNLTYKVDTYTALNDTGNTGALLAAYDSGDGLHPNTTGQNVIGDTIYNNTSFTKTTTIPKIYVAKDLHISQSLTPLDNPIFKTLTTTDSITNGLYLGDATQSLSLSTALGVKLSYSTNNFISIGNGGGNISSGGSGAAIITWIGTTSSTIAQNLLITIPNNTNQTASTETIGFKIDNGTITHNTGTISLQRDIYTNGRTHAFAAPSTITVGYSNYYDPLIAGTNATITTNFVSGFNGNIHIIGKTFIGPTAITPTALVHLSAPTTSYAQLNLVAGTAPTSPNDGDIWREDNTNTGLKIRVNGVTKTITLS